MGKATVIEAQNSNTTFEEGNSKGILGKLKGIFADYKNGTRNSDRLYTEELWDNRVFGSEDVMEALETKTLFGELDHPDGDRCETLAKNAAITITKLEKRPEEGVIYGEAEILDTPTGRIVRALADSGAKLGISSRGMGEEIYENGQNIIDPDTYDFITFDVVVTPANTKARVSLSESKHRDMLTENFKKEITESETENQLNQIKTVVENVNMENKNTLLNMINEKISKFNNVNVSTKLTEANKQIALNLIKEKYENTKSQLDESIKASNSLAEENAKLIKENEFLSTSRTMLQEKVKDMTQKSVDEKDTSDLDAKLTEANSKIADLEQQLLNENRKYREMSCKNRKVANMKTENLTNSLNDQIAKLKASNSKLIESLAAKDETIKKLNEAKTNSDNKVDEYSKVLVENKKLLDRIKALQESNTKLQENNTITKNKLNESKLNESKKILTLENKIKQLEAEKSKMEEAQNRFSQLSFNPVGTFKAVAENFQNADYTQEEKDLYDALTNQ